MAEIEDKINHLLSRNVDEIIVKDHLKTALKSGKKLRIKHGIDPTGEKIHIGRAIVLWKLKEFQALGHKIILIIGDFTAQIGDPSDKLEKRPFLTQEQVEKNLKNYLLQIGKILELEKTEVRYNSTWLKKLNFQTISHLAEIFTVQQMLERKNFKARIKKQEEISIREFLYPLMQGYDSVAIKADVEIGGSDQLFNLMAGRKIQEAHNQKPQNIITTKMLIGTDNRKMSTSWGNVINVSDSPKEQFGKIMSMRDSLMIDYFTLATDVPLKEIAEYKKNLKKQEIHPKTLKETLAFEIVKCYYGEKTAQKAADEFNKVFSNKELPNKIPKLKILQRINNKQEINIIDLLLLSGISSKNEARRLIQQKGVKINDEIKNNPVEKFSFKGGEILKIGKRKFFEIE